MVLDSSEVLKGNNMHILKGLKMSNGRYNNKCGEFNVKKYFIFP
jgi:hypothetical protein